MSKYVITHIFIVSFILIPATTIQSWGKINVNLRPYYKELSVSEVLEIHNVSILKKEKWGFYGHSTIDHDYYLKTINDDKVVIDRATGLMWYQSGSDKYVNWTGAKKWVKKLNEKGYAGYKDWRLPTLEEAVSLLESSRKSGGLYIDAVFDETKWSMWTGDSHMSEDSISLNGAWRITLNDGVVRWSSNSYDIFLVRPVRLNK